MIALLIKASLIIIVLLAFYKVFLEKESFFVANRIYLLSCLIFACTLPFIGLPKLVEHQGVVATLARSLEGGGSPAELPIISQEARSSNGEHDNSQYAAPTNASSSSGSDALLEPRNLPDEQAKNEVLPTKRQQSEKGAGYWLMLLYGFGVMVLSLNLLMQIVQTLWKIYKNEDKVEDEGVVLVNLKGEVEPCSFFNYVFINPASYEYEIYEQVVAHESIHVKEKHTIDILLSEIAVIVLWFNPFIWLLRKEVEKNIEYQTDDLMIDRQAAAKESYQLNLIKIATHTQPLAITTNYNQSLITKRILKMNTKKSNQFSYWKYSFTAPLLFMLLLLLNEPKVGNAQNMALQNDAEIVPEFTLEQTDETASTTSDLSETTATVEDDCQKLTQAVREQNLIEIKALLTRIDPNCIEPVDQEIYRFSPAVGFRPTLQTPLSAAAAIGSLEIAKLLVAAGAKINTKDGFDRTALMHAADKGHLDLVQFLIKKGAKVNTIRVNPC